jgi:hypothetical protein
MALGISRLMDFVQLPFLKNATFLKLDLFPSCSEEWEMPILLGPLERTNPNHWTIDKVLKPSNQK